MATDAVPPLSELQAAVARIRAGVASQTWPYTYFTAAADWSPAPPHDDLQCFLDAIVSTRSEVSSSTEQCDIAPT